MTGTYTYRPPLGLDIRVNPPKESQAAPETHGCAWPDCNNKALYRAPKTPNSREFQWFCLDHVRSFNKSWNFFQDMNDEDVERFVEGNTTGHRPTWKLGNRSTHRSWKSSLRAGAAAAGFHGSVEGRGSEDLFGLFGDIGRPQSPFNGQPARALTRSQIKALQTLDLEESATRDQIKTRYKELVKRYHPDANGGDTGAVERLRRVIRAYKTFQSSSFGKEKPGFTR